MHTLFRSVTGGVDWGDMANLLIYINWIWGYLVKHSFHCLCFVLSVFSRKFRRYLNWRWRSIFALDRPVDTREALSCCLTRRILFLLDLRCGRIVLSRISHFTPIDSGVMFLDWKSNAFWDPGVVSCCRLSCEGYFFTGYIASWFLKLHNFESFPPNLECRWKRVKTVCCWLLPFGTVTMPPKKSRGRGVLIFRGPKCHDCNLA